MATFASPSRDNTYISWLYQPSQRTSQRRDSLAVVGDLYITNVLTADVRRRKLKVRARPEGRTSFPTLGHLPIAAVEPQLRPWATAKNNERYQPITIEGWLSHIHGIGEHARELGLYNGPPLSKFVRGLRKHSNESQTHSPSVIRKNHLASPRCRTTSGSGWGALNGLRPRERAPPLWENFQEGPRRRWRLSGSWSRGKSNRFPIDAVDERPISKSIAALLSAYREVTDFPKDEDFIFASTTGERACPDVRHLPQPSRPRCR